MSAVAVAALAVAVVADTVVGELPTRAHPVAWFGRVVGRVDRSYDRPLVAGVVIAAVLPVAAALSVAGAVALVTGFDAWIGSLAAGVGLFVTTSLRMLVGAARDVIRASDSDVETARQSVVALVGRDPQSLSPAQLRSAAVESAAENLADGLLAPLVAFAVGAQVSLVVGAGAAAWIKAVNTLDSMLGYPEKRHGTASARLDDVVMWVPARVAAVLIALAAVSPRALSRASGDYGTPPSPNSGWPMAALAAVHGVRLEKPGVYTLGADRALPTTEESIAGVHTVTRAGGLAIGIAGVTLWL